MSNVVRLESRVEKAWAEYLAARDMADGTKLTADADVGKFYWAAFLAEFVPPELRDEARLIAESLS